MKLLPFLMVFDLLMFTSIFGYGPGSEAFELRIRIRQSYGSLHPDSQHRFLGIFLYTSSIATGILKQKFFRKPIFC
jgi:hypothetical protein